MSTQSSSKRAASPIVYDKTKLKRASSHSASSSEGEVTDSDNEAPRFTQEKPQVPVIKFTACQK